MGQARSPANPDSGRSSGQSHRSRPPHDPDPRPLLTRVYFGDERPLIRRSLNALEGQLDPALFFRAGRNEILNLKWIDKVDLSVSAGLVATLRGGRTVEMSAVSRLAYGKCSHSEILHPPNM